MDGRLNSESLIKENKEDNNNGLHCLPDVCGRAAYYPKNLVSDDEIKLLNEIMDSALIFGGGSGSASIFELATGAVSYQDSFINYYDSIKSKIKQWQILYDTQQQQERQLQEGEVMCESRKFPHIYITHKHLDVYEEVVSKIKTAIEQQFNVSGLFLTSPSFFSVLDGDKKPL